MSDCVRLGPYVRGQALLMAEMKLSNNSGLQGQNTVLDPFHMSLSTT